jgi:hypothetical protein
MLTAAIHCNKKKSRTENVFDYCHNVHYQANHVQGCGFIENQLAFFLEVMYNYATENVFE